MRAAAASILLTDNPEPQALRKRHDGAGNGGSVGVNEDVTHKRAVNLQLVQRQALEVRQRGIAGAEVMERKSPRPVPSTRALF